MTEAARSLAEYAAQRTSKNGPDCWVCGLPERAEVEDAFDRLRVPIPAAVEWLKTEKGYGGEATIHKLTHHLKNHDRAPQPN